MESYKKEFIEFLVESGALTFGDFTTKSGRKTPYFINTGNFSTGSGLNRAGDYYSKAIMSQIGGEFNVLFGPAYKGIPLAAVTSSSLYSNYGKDISVCFNRKEEKDHGEGGSIIGKKPHKGDRVLLIDDVVTAGTSVRESMAMLKKIAGLRFSGLIVSVDRREKGESGKSALAEIEERYDMPAAAIVTIDEVVSYLFENSGVIDSEMKKRIDDYRGRYGVNI